MSSRRQFSHRYSENDLVHKVRRRATYLFSQLISSIGDTFFFQTPVQRFVFFPTQELERLDNDAKVYKLIGPALIRQDKVEAISNVAKRMGFIEHET